MIKLDKVIIISTERNSSNFGISDSQTLKISNHKDKKSYWLKLIGEIGKNNINNIKNLLVGVVFPTNFRGKKNRVVLVKRLPNYNGNDA